MGNCRLSSSAPRRKGCKQALKDLRALAQKGFGPIRWGFGEKLCQQASTLARQLALDPLATVDIERVKDRLIHTGVLANPRVIANLLNRSTKENQRLRHLWPRTNWLHCPQTLSVASRPQPRGPVVKHVSSSPSGSGESWFEGGAEFQ